MQRPERSTYTPLDFVTWRAADSLVIAPKFQRRGVWTTAARSFLIDTLIQGLPVPPIFIRVVQSEDNKRIIREVIDGQQRMSAILDFIDGKYQISTSLDADYAGKNFSELNREQQNAITQYGFVCEVFHGISDSQVLEIFARLNTYSVRLNRQELRNGKYFGYFKQLAYRLALEHIQFWRDHRIFGERAIARMNEVELTSELIIAQLDGMQDKKATIDGFYDRFDENFPNMRIVEKRFKSTVDSIGEAVGQKLKETEFNRPPLFYSLFCVVYHHTFGLPQTEVPTPQRPLNQTDMGSLNSALLDLSDKIELARDDQEVPSRYRQFVNACLTSTDNLPQRKTRFETLLSEIF